MPYTIKNTGTNTTVATATTRANGGYHLHDGNYITLTGLSAQPTHGARYDIFDGNNQVATGLLYRGGGYFTQNERQEPDVSIYQTSSSWNELDNLAGELLSLSSEEELDHFFGDFVKKAMGGIKSFANSPIGKTLVGGLKTVAKQALPQVAGAIGNAIAPGAGGAIGQKIGSFAASKLEAEDRFLGALLGEGPDTEDQFLGSILGGLLETEGEAMEKAKEVVKVAAAATKKAKAAPAHADVRAVVRSAIMDAMKEYAPRITSGASGGHTCSSVGDGRWYRRGNKIVIVGA